MKVKFTAFIVLASFTAVLGWFWFQYHPYPMGKGPEPNKGKTTVKKI